MTEQHSWGPYRDLPQEVCTRCGVMQTEANKDVACSGPKTKAGDPEKFPDWLTVGASFRVDAQPGETRTWHVRGFVDGLCVMRRWELRKACWRYVLETPYWVYIRRDTLELLQSGDGRQHGVAEDDSPVRWQRHVAENND